MKKLIIGIVVLFLSITLLYAQSTVSDAEKRARAIPQPVVTKGYYTIYKNAGKLNHSRPLPNTTASANEVTVIKPGKDYYSMNNHHKKIYKSGVSFIARKQMRPSASKGYYNTSLPANEVAETKMQEAAFAPPQYIDSTSAIAD